RPRVVRAPVGGNDAIGIAGDVFIKENHLFWELDDPAWRANAGNAWLGAVEYGVRLAFVRFQGLDLVPKFRLVRRGLRPWERSRHFGNSVPRGLINSRTDDLAVHAFRQPDRG